MKTQQKNFVIENKSRRPTQTAERSIWGTTDFKELLKKAEDDAPQLFGSDTDLDTHSDGATGPVPERQAVTPLVPIEDVQSEVFTEIQRACVEGKMAVTRGKSRKPRRKGSAQSPHGVLALVISSSVPGSGQVDDLAVLEAENKWLKNLLVDKFIAENDRLRQMLERFFAM